MRIDVWFSAPHQVFSARQGQKIFWLDPQQQTIDLYDATDKTILRLLDEMVETMQAAPGLGLAAPQVGESIRCAVVAAPDEEARKLVNPRIVARADKVLGP